MAFLIDGKSLVEFPVMSPLGRFVIPDVPTGIQKCRVATQMAGSVDDGQLELFINQMPDDLTDASVWKRRTVYTLDRENPLTVSAVKPSEETITLNVVCYYDNRVAEEDERFTILATIDDGIRPMPCSQPSTQYTALLREYSVRNQSSPAIYLDKEGIKPGESQTFFVPLNDDVPPGRHRVAFSLLSGESVKIRFFVMESHDWEEKVRYWGKAE
jgi:hypothetical protein